MAKYYYKHAIYRVQYKIPNYWIKCQTKNTKLETDVHFCTISGGKLLLCKPYTVTVLALFPYAN